MRFFIIHSKQRKKMALGLDIIGSILGNAGDVISDIADSKKPKADPTQVEIAARKAAEETAQLKIQEDAKNKKFFYLMIGGIAVAIAILGTVIFIATRK